MSQANVELVKNLYAAFGRGDVAAVAAGMDPAIVWNEAENFPYADRNPYIGLGAIAEGIFGRFATDWDKFQVNPAEYLDAGDTVITIGRYTGTYKSTSKSINAQFAHFWQIRDGKVIAFQQYTDTAQAQRVVNTNVEPAVCN